MNNDGAWHFVVYRQSIGAHSLLVDGVLQTLTYSDGSSSDNWWFDAHPNPLAKFLVGARQSATGFDGFFDGDIDEVTVVDRPLPDDVILNNKCGTMVQP